MTDTDTSRRKANFKNLGKTHEETFLVAVAVAVQPTGRCVLVCIVIMSLASILSLGAGHHWGAFASIDGPRIRIRLIR